MNVVTLARLERRMRPLLARLPASLAVRMASAGRRRFIEALGAYQPRVSTRVPGHLAVTLWGDVVFRAPLLNAAGMWKLGEGHAVALAQGAGGYLAGTTTSRPRPGNASNGVLQPFAPYPRSGAASNWLGLPNDGHHAVAERLARIERVTGFPIGASVAIGPEPGVDEATRRQELVDGMVAHARAGVDFLELNESCPNTEDGEGGWQRLAERLAYLEAAFLSRRQRNVPVVVKLSLDTGPAQIPRMVELLETHGFDGVNFGNTSVAYDALASSIKPRERKLFEHFTSTFGGGVSGRPLNAIMLECVRRAARARSRREFAVIATGGIEAAGDVVAAQSAGADLCQWYTGYFEALGRDGRRVYQRLYSALG